MADEPLGGAPSPPPPQHADTALYSRPFGPVAAVAVTFEGNVVAHLRHGFGNEAHRGGVLHMPLILRVVREDLSALISDLRDRGVPAADGIPALLGTVTAHGARVGTELTPYDSYLAFDRAVRSYTYVRVSRGHTPERLKQLETGYGLNVRAEIEAALQGEVRVTDERARRIAEVDAALLQHPAEADRTVVFRVNTSEFEGGATPGARTFFPAHLRVHPDPERPSLADTEVLVRVVVPAGTGLWEIEADSADKLPLLLLPRGLTIVVDAVRDDRVVVDARIESETRTALTVGAYLGRERALRDIRADEEYFAELVVAQSRWVGMKERDLYRRKLPVLHADGVDRTALIGRDALNVWWKAFHAQYSQGAPVAALRDEFFRLLSTTERALELLRDYPMDGPALVFRTNKNFYRYWLLLVSLALALRVDEATFDRVVAAAEFGWGDRLIDRLIHSRRPEHPIGEDLMFARVVGRLDRAMTSADPVKEISVYLDRWYSLWKGIFGWGGHEFLNKHQYEGYWAFEALGVVAALDIDDSPFRDEEYYPKDLAGTRINEDVTR